MLNGGSSSGKTELARSLQGVVAEPWLLMAVDSLIEAMPAALQNSGDGIEFASDGAVSPGPQFRELEAAWQAGVGAMARAGARIIIDDVFLGGSATQER